MSRPIYQHLLQRLVTGEFSPGQRLQAELLRHEYQASATTLREVLFRLSTQGLVVFLEQRGFRVPEHSDALQHDLTRTRILLECEGARCSIERGGIAWEARLSAAHHELKHIEMRARTQCGQELLALWSEAELKFHRTLIEACDSPVLLALHMQVYLRFRQQLITKDKEFAFIPENIEQHQGILDAVLLRDKALVCERIVAHLSRNLRAQAKA